MQAVDLTDVLVNKLCGVYVLYRNDTVIYVGQSSDIVARVPMHYRKQYDRVEYYPCDVTDMDNMERRLIRKHQPEYNRAHKTLLPDVKITLADLGIVLPVAD